MDNEKIINEKAYKIGLDVKSSDRKLIQNNLEVSEDMVNKALSGTRRCLRGKSATIIELAEKIAEINKSKAELI